MAKMSEKQETLFRKPRKKYETIGGKLAQYDTHDLISMCIPEELRERVLEKLLDTKRGSGAVAASKLLYKVAWGTAFATENLQRLQVCLASDGRWGKKRIPVHDAVVMKLQGMATDLLEQLAIALNVLVRHRTAEGEIDYETLIADIAKVLISKEAQNVSDSVLISGE